MVADLRTFSESIISINPTLEGDPPAITMTQNLATPIIPSGAQILPYKIVIQDQQNPFQEMTPE